MEIQFITLRRAKLDDCPTLIIRLPYVLPAFSVAFICIAVRFQIAHVNQSEQNDFKPFKSDFCSSVGLFCSRSSIKTIVQVATSTSASIER